jgi:hypothetical protein
MDMNAISHRDHMILTWSAVFLTSFTLSLRAEPIITSVSGPVQNGSTVILAGSGFGTKTAAAPYIWDDVENGLSSKWGSIGDLEVEAERRTPFSSASAYLNFTASRRDGFFTAPNNRVAPSWYVSYWFKANDNWDWGTTQERTDAQSGDNNFLSNIKVFRMWNPSSANTENLVAAYAGWENRVVYNVENTDAASMVQTPVIANARGAITRGNWHHFQFAFAENSDLGESDGRFRMWFDGRQVADRSNLLTRQGSDQFKRPLIIGFDSVWGPNTSRGESDDAPNDFYIDDVYVDTTWQRVELANAPIYGDATVRELQPSLQDWSSNRVTFALNQASFAQGLPRMFS